MEHVKVESLLIPTHLYLWPNTVNNFSKIGSILTKTKAVKMVREDNLNNTLHRQFLLTGIRLSKRIWGQTPTTILPLHTIRHPFWLWTQVSRFNCTLLKEIQTICQVYNGIRLSIQKLLAISTITTKWVKMNKRGQKIDNRSDHITLKRINRAREIDITEAKSNPKKRLKSKLKSWEILNYLTS